MNQNPSGAKSLGRTLRSCYAWLRDPSSYRIEVLLMFAVFLIMLLLTRWDALVHGGDQLDLRMLARGLFSGRPFTSISGTPDNNYPPLPILLWGILIRLTSWENSFLVFNAMVWSVQVFIWSKLSNIVLNRRWPGLLTFILFSFSFSTPMVVTTGLKEPLALLFLLLFVLQYTRESGTYRYLSAGVFLGLSYLCRYNILPTLGVVLIFSLFPFNRKSIWRFGTLFLGFLIATFPWLLRNWMVFGDPFEYMVMKNKFIWVPYFRDRLGIGGVGSSVSSDSQIIARFGFVFVWTKAIAHYLTNLREFLQITYPHWIVTLCGFTLFRWAPPKKSLFDLRSFCFQFFVMLSLTPATCFGSHHRYILLPFILLFFMSVSILSLIQDLFNQSPAKTQLALRRIVIGIVLLILLWSPTLSVVSNVRRQILSHSNTVWVLEKEVGRHLKAIVSPEDVIMMYWGQPAAYYTGLPAVAVPPLNRDALNYTIDRHGVTIVVDMKVHDIAKIIPERLAKIDTVPSLSNTPVFGLIPRAGSTKPVNIYRVISQGVNE